MPITADVIITGVFLAVVIICLLLELAAHCECAQPEELAAASARMAEYLHSPRQKQAEIYNWIRAHRVPLGRKLGDSIDMWLFAVKPADHKYAESRFLALIDRANEHRATARDIDALWAIYYATYDTAVIDLIREQVLCGQDAIIEKVVWSVESVTGLPFEYIDAGPLIQARINIFRIRK